MMWRKLAIVMAMAATSCSGLDAGWRAQKSGDYDEAQRQAIIALSKEPKNPEVYRLIATTAYLRGDYDAALKSAKFASSLDGGTEASERLVRDVCVAQKSWDCVCESGLGAVERGVALTPEDVAQFREGYAQSAGSAGSYGCLRVLEAQGEAPDGADGVRAGYADLLATSGRVMEAVEIERECADAEVSHLRAARHLFWLKKTADAEALLREHVDSGQTGTVVTRSLRAAEIASEAFDWPFAAEILGNVKSRETEIPLGIALRHAFRPEEAEAVFEQHFAQERSAAVALGEARILLDAGYGADAMTAVETSTEAMESDDAMLKAAELFHASGRTDLGAQIVTRLSDRHLREADFQMQMFAWAQAHGMPRAALTAGERARKLGMQDDDFIASLLELYVTNREIRSFEQEAEAWIARDKAPAVRSRTTVARLEVHRKNWHGVLERLTPLDKAGALPEDARGLFYRALQTTHEYAGLYEALAKYEPEMAPLSRAEYFESPDAKDEYMRSVAPLLAESVSAGDRFEGEMAVARYHYDVDGDEQSGAEAVERALALGMSDGYSRSVLFLRSRDVPKAVDVAVRWRDADAHDAQPCELLGSLYLRAGRPQEAGEAFDCMTARSGDRRKALSAAFQAFQANRETAAGIAWIETQDYPERLVVHAEACEAAALSRTGEESQVRAWRQAAIEDYTRLLEERPSDALGYAISLGALEAWPESVRAYEKADAQKAKMSASQKISRVRTMIRARADGAKIEKIVSQMDNENDAMSMITMLETEQALLYAEPLLESMLGSKKASTRIKAFTYLFRVARFSGDTRRIAQYATELEQSAPENAEIRTKLAEASLQMHRYDDAYRHLVYLQGIRPDSRDVLRLAMAFVRRAPEHRGAAELEQGILQGAEGVYHRLEWLSQIYEQQGELDRALEYAEKALASTTAAQDGLRLRLLRLYVRTGRVGTPEYARLYAAYHSSTAWKPENIRILAKDARDAGYYEVSMQWLREAIAIAPQSVTLKRVWLETALSTEREGMIAQSLDAAIEPPVAEVMEPLHDAGAMMDAIQAVDAFEAMGEYEMALPSLLSILPYYLEARGRTATVRALSTWADYVPDWKPEVARILANALVMGDDPCLAVAHVSGLDDADSWALLLTHCPEAWDGTVRAYRESMQGASETRRDTVTTAIYRRLMQLRNADGAHRFALDMGIATGAYDEFARVFYTEGALPALHAASRSGIEPEHIEHVFDSLAANGYVNEAASIARDEIKRIPEESRGKVALKADLLGKHAPEFEEIIANRATADDYAAVHGYRSVSAEQIARWAERTPTSNLTPLIEFTLRCAEANPSAGTLDALKKEMQRRSARTSVHIAFALLAVELGFDADALEVTKSLIAGMPDSDIVYRVKSEAEAHLGKVDDAVATLTAGSREAAYPEEYWKQALESHRTSDVRIRETIHAALLAIAPRNPAYLAEGVDIALAAGNAEKAREYADAAYRNGDVSVLTRIAEAYESHGAIAQMPVYEGDGTTRNLVRGRVLLANGDEDGAAEAFREAARTAPWPPTVYARVTDIWLRHGNMPRAEQTIALFMQRFPHAASPHVYRACYEMTRGNLDNAWQDYLAARAASLETDPWMPEIVGCAARLQLPEFAKRIYVHEASHGSLNESLWLREILAAHRAGGVAPERTVAFLQAVLAPETQIAPEVLELRAAGN